MQRCRRPIERNVELNEEKVLKDLEVHRATLYGLNIESVFKYIRALIDLWKYHQNSVNVQYIFRECTVMLNILKSQRCSDIGVDTLISFFEDFLTLASNSVYGDSKAKFRVIQGGDRRKKAKKVLVFGHLGLN